MTKWLFASILSLAAASPAFAFRCGTKLVTDGDTRSEVLQKCGDPTEIDRRSIFRQPLYWIGGRPYNIGNGVVEIPVEIWIYNFGPSKLMRQVRFEDGKVVEIETLGYGYHETPQPPRPTP
jgi:hypothetical protein